MLDFIRVIVWIALISSSTSATDLDIDLKVNKINQLSMESLGISINALSHLSEVSKNTYLTLDILEKTEKLKYMYELQSKGYVQIYKVKGLPDGNSQNEEFVNIVALPKGIGVINILQDINATNNKVSEEIQNQNKQIITLKSISELRAEAELVIEDVAQQNRKDEQFLSEINQRLIEIKEGIVKLTEDNQYLDLNNDGKQDVFYTVDDDYSYTTSDRNFDGKNDERWKYDQNERLISGAGDNDFDGVFETKYIIHNGNVRKELIDSNKNEKFDIYIYYESGVSIYSERYYPSSEIDKQAKIGKVSYEFGKISEQEVFSDTNLTEIEFQNQRIK